MPVDGIPALLARHCSAKRFDRVFNILHGNTAAARTACCRACSRRCGVPYTGSGVLGSALSMDKIRTKQVWLSLGLPTPRYVRLDARRRRARRGARARPAGDRQAGLRRLERRREPRVQRRRPATQAVALAARYPGELLMEQLIEGDELTVGILGDEALPSIRIVPAGEYYDYHAKYVAEDTQYLCPGLRRRRRRRDRARSRSPRSAPPAAAAGAAST